MTSLSPTLYSWTASYINTQGRYLLLQYMIESLIKQKVPHIQISLSYIPEMAFIIPELKKLQEETKEAQIEFFFQPGRMYQFQHLKFLLDNFKGQPQDMILFMDDDDLLVGMIDWEPFNVVKGKQYVPGEGPILGETYRLDYNGITQVSKETVASWKIVYDFSGYMARYYLVKYYFEEDELANTLRRLRTTYESLKKRQQTEDTTFMKFLDVQDNIGDPEIPFVFHRLWQDAEKPEESNIWRKESGF